MHAARCRLFSEHYSKRHRTFSFLLLLALLLETADGRASRLAARKMQEINTSLRSRGGINALRRMGRRFAIPSLGGQGNTLDLWLDLRKEPEEIIPILNQLEEFYHPEKPPIKAVISTTTDLRSRGAEAYQNTELLQQDKDLFLLNEKMIPVGFEVTPVSDSVSLVNGLVRNGYSWVMISPEDGSFDAKAVPLIRITNDFADHCRGISGSNTRVAVCCRTATEIESAIAAMGNSSGAIVVPFDMQLLSFIRGLSSATKE
eukprot:jgi/Bigna1/73384/fgenesh1_pg.24_\